MLRGDVAKKDGPARILSEHKCFMLWILCCLLLESTLEKCNNSCSAIWVAGFMSQLSAELLEGMG